jgi:hypothetical protein
VPGVGPVAALRHFAAMLIERHSTAGSGRSLTRTAATSSSVATAAILNGRAALKLSTIPRHDAEPVALRENARRWRSHE